MDVSAIKVYTEEYTKALQETDKVFDSMTAEQQLAFLGILEENLKIDVMYINKLNSLVDETIEQIRIVNSIKKMT